MRPERLSLAASNFQLCAGCSDCLARCPLHPLEVRETPLRGLRLDSAGKLLSRPGARKRKRAGRSDLVHRAGGHAQRTRLVVPLPACLRSHCRPGPAVHLELVTKRDLAVDGRLVDATIRVPKRDEGFHGSSAGAPAGFQAQLRNRKRRSISLRKRWILAT